MSPALPAPDEAVRMVLDHVQPLDAEHVPLEQALGRTLAESLASAGDVPGFDNSAMDGFALRAADTRDPGSDPVRLKIVGESRAGAPATATVDAGQAVRISTGAMMPAGADAVVRVEDTAEDRDGEVSVVVPVAPGKDVRRAGDDIRAGERVLAPGRRLDPAAIGVAASVGAAQVLCARRPLVAMVSTGDELVTPGAPLAPGAIWNTNGYAVPAQATRAGAHSLPAMSVGDDRPATIRVLREALEADVAIVTGGVSVGPHDHVKPALGELGVEQVFWGVALRPGKPTWFGTLPREGAGPRLVFGLPGNPVSAMVTFHLFVRPAISALLGGDPSERRTTATMDADYAKSPGRAHAVRCRLKLKEDGWHATPTKAQGSHVLTSMLDAEALALLDVDQGGVRAGERVPIELLQER